MIYFPGYDLRPARYCFPLLRKEFDTFLKIRKVNGALSQLSEGLDPGGTTASWSGHVDWPDSRVETTFVQLGWRDVIKADFRRSWPRTIADAIQSFMMIAQAGGYRAALKSNWAHGVFCLYPPLDCFSISWPACCHPFFWRRSFCAMWARRFGKAMPKKSPGPCCWEAARRGCSRFTCS